MHYGKHNYIYRFKSNVINTYYIVCCVVFDTHTHKKFNRKGINT